MKIEDLNVGMSYEKIVVVNEETGLAFAEISKDYNPIHLYSDFAEKTMFKKRICHGMLFGSYISGVIGNEFPGQGSIYMKQDLSFRAPIYYNTEIKIVIEVKELFVEKKRVLLRTMCMNNDKIMIDGEALIMLDN